jgi:pilus assembly protein CpaF
MIGEVCHGGVDDALVRRLREEVSRRLTEDARRREAAGDRPLSVEAQRAFGRELVAQRLDGLALERADRDQVLLSEAEEDALADAVFNALFGLGHLEQYLRDPSIENIVANGCDDVWVIRQDGSKTRGEPLAATDEELIELLRAAASRMGMTERRFDLSAPELNMRLPDGSRLHAIMAVTRRPCVTIRRHRHVRVALDDLLDLGTVDAALASFFRAVVQARHNVVVAGATNAGKTTFLRALLSETPSDERLIVVEDESELNLSASPDQHRDVVEMESRQANIEGSGGVNMWTLVRSTLRMAPQRVIVGEVRGGEITNMLHAMSTGDTGGMCTLHAKSSAGAFNKIVLYAGMGEEPLSPEQTIRTIADALDFVVFLRRLPDGRRVVSSVREVAGEDGAQVQSNEVFRPRWDGRAVVGDPFTDSRLEDLRDVGFDVSLLSQPDGWWRP